MSRTNTQSSYYRCHVDCRPRAGVNLVHLVLAPVPRVTFACIPSAALGNLEVTAPAREPSLVTLISQTPCYHIRVFLSCLLCLPYSCLYRRYFLSCNSLAITSYWRNLEESSIVYLYSHSASFP